MSAPSIPPDNSLAVEQQREQDAATQRTQDKATADSKAAQLAALRSGASDAARGTASRYFTTQGVDPSQYTNQINDRINEITGSIAPDDPNPGAYFKDIGPSVFNDAQSSYENNLTRQINNLFPSNYDTTRITDDAAQPYLDSINSSQRADADQIVQNMLDRGVINPTGKQAAEKNLDNQAFNIKDQLKQIGDSTISSGRQSIDNIINRAKSGASTATLGQQFDPNSYSSDVDKAFNDFVGSLGDKIKAKIPGSLYNTQGLAAVAGAGQGAQNTKFDPNALAGIISNNDPNKPPNAPVTNSPENIF